MFSIFKPHQRWTIAVAILAVLGTALPISTHAATFPALNNPATKETHPGKFVWAELFTGDTASAAKYYAGLFGWTTVVLEQHGVTYTVFKNGVRPVAGLRLRSAPAPKRAARWIDYIAVTDMASALSAATKAGGEIRADARSFPHLGLQAIVTDSAGSPVGLLQSSSGDSADNEPAPGEWNWFHLLVNNPAAAAGFYRQVFGYDVASDNRSGKKDELLLSSGTLNRAGVSLVPENGNVMLGWLGVVRVARLDETLARVPALGGEIVVPPHDAAFGSRFAVVADPTGGTVGIVEYLNNANPANHP